MIGVGTLLLVLWIGLLVTRVATVALRTTGMSHEAARFQARSAFFGVGFTTAESEDIVNHPARRQIVLTLMLFSSAGVVTTLASLLLSFAGASGVREPVMRLGALAVGLIILSLIAGNAWFDRRLSRGIERVLGRFTELDVRDYVRVLRIQDRYSIGEILIDDNHDWLGGRTIRDLDLSAEGVVILGVIRSNGQYLGAPIGATFLEPGDTIVVYGRTSVLDELDDRVAGPSGDRAHRFATVEHEAIVESQTASDPVLTNNPGGTSA